MEEIGQVYLQLYAVLQTLCEGEAFTIVRGPGKGNWFEACCWSKTCNASTNFESKQVLKAGRPFKLQESRKHNGRTRHELDEEIESLSWSTLSPSELERHLQLNRPAWLYSTYQEGRAEVSLFPETRLGAR